MKHLLRAFCLAAVLSPALAAAQVYLPPGVGLPPQSVIGNTLSQTGDAVAVSFAQLRSSLSIAGVKTCASHQWFNTLATGGTLGCSQPALSDIAGFGTGGAAALGINVGSPGSFIVNGGALGTPSSANLANATGLPISSGVSGLGTAVPTALAINVGSAGALVTFNGALGTPLSGTLTNATGLPIATGVSGLGAGVATWAATPSSANLRAALTDETGTGAAYFQGGDLGTPSAGVATNLTGTAAGLTAGTFAAGSATNLTSGTLPAARTNGHMNGTATNDNAAAGEVGEYIESVIAVGSATALTTATPKTVTSISLTAGDWDLTGIVNFSSAATTSITNTIASYSTTTNTLDTTAGRWAIHTFAAVVPGNLTGLSETLPRYRFSLSGTTTIFLVAQSTFTVSTNAAWGIISARRVR